MSVTTPSFRRLNSLRVLRLTIIRVSSNQRIGSARLGSGIKRQLTSDKLRRHFISALAPLSLLIVLACLGSCKNAKYVQRQERQAALDKGDTTEVRRLDSLAAFNETHPTPSTEADTSRSEIAVGIDSLKKQVSGFLKSLLPRGEDTGSIVSTPPAGSTNNPVVGLDAKREGFLRSQVVRDVEFDSTGSVILHERIMGLDIKQPRRLSLAEYLRLREENTLETGFREGIRQSVDTTTTAEKGFFSDYNKIEIPIPPSIVPSIFGRPSINLRVSGDVAIHLAYRDNKFLATSGALFSGSESGLDFRQEINISTNGSIGDKLKIGADWGSGRSFQFENLLKLGYKGFPEEIIQSIEAGNVNLVTPSKYIGVQQALFGLKMVDRFGPVYFTALAAQKKGERQSKSFGGGGAGDAVSQERIIQPSNYKRNAFFLDTNFIPNYEKYYSQIVPQPNLVPQDNILTDGKDVEVWISTFLTDRNPRHAIAWYDLPVRPAGGYSAQYRNPSSGIAGDNQTGVFTRLDTNRYQIDKYTGVLTLTQEPSDEQVIAVSYRMENPTRQYGDPITTSDTLVLKLVKPRYVFKTPGLPAWKNILKNSYYIGGSNFDVSKFGVRIVYTRPSGEQIEIVRSAAGIKKSIALFGLDRANNSNPADQTSDGLVDVGSAFPNNAILDVRTGTLRFPYLEPFGERVLNYYKIEGQKNSRVRQDLSYYFPEIYNTDQEVLRRNPKNNQISINVQFAGGVSNTINLNAFNLVQGSVKVTIGGRELAENSDYRVDYNSGTVTLLKPDLATTGTINIDYETHDIFSNSTKNVLGFRGEMPILDRGLFGISLMNYSMHLPSIKTRQGEEPLSNWILGFDAGYKLDAPFITDALNALPIFNLKDKSDLSFKTDFALSLPNPNTQRSPIADDSGFSIAYMDDFEGGKNEFPLYMSYAKWSDASQPVDSAFRARYAELFRDSLVNANKGKTFWFERFPQDVLIKTIKPNRSTSRPTDAAQVLDYIFDPSRPGANNPYFSNSQPSDKWGGMMQYLQGLNVQATNTDALEFWMKLESDGGNSDGLLRFDLGTISEDIIPDGRLETEDANGNGRYDPGEDVGLDVLTDDQERAKYPGAVDPNDPDHDNYSFDRYSTAGDKYDHINGTQGNQNGGSVSLHPDTEDLNGNTSLDVTNNYYEYEIPLKRDNNKYIIGQGNDGWVQYRIPLADFRRIIGAQDTTFSNINYYRIWTKDFPGTVHVRFHEITLVGSQWTRGTAGFGDSSPLADSSFKVGYVNIEDNANAPTNYTSPPGAERNRLAGSVSYILGNEQSLSMSVANLPDTARREAVRVFQSPNDIFNYRSMAVFVHGDDARPQQISDTNAVVWVYVRFGTDAFNYYEYRRPLLRGWQNFHVDFGILASLKAARPFGAASVTIPANDGYLGSSYTVVGNPTLTNAPIFTLGLENRTKFPLTTQIWFDELRLLNANDKIDYAYNASTQLKLAEFGRVTASIINERPDFHRVDERFNQTRTLNFNWNVTGEFAMEKILPEWLERQSRLPLTVSHSETILRPKYLPNTDVQITEAIAKIQQQQSAGALSASAATGKIDSIRAISDIVSIKNSFGATGVKLVFPGSFFLLESFLNRLTYGFGYAEEFSHSPRYEYNRAWKWTGTLLYDLPRLPNLSLSPFSWIGSDAFAVGRFADWKINFLPQRVSFAVSATRGRVHLLNRITTLQFPPLSDAIDSMEVLRSRVPFINREFTATRGMGISQWKLTEGGLLSPSFDYKLDVTSNLGPLEIEGQYNRNGEPIIDPRFADTAFYYQRPINAILKDIFLSHGQLVRPGRDFQSLQSVSMNTSPKLPYFFGLEKLARPVFSYRVDYRWQDAQTNEQTAKQAAWSNTITTGVEINVREFGDLIFGKADNETQRGSRGSRSGRGNRSRVDELGGMPDKIDNQPVDTRGTPVPNPRNNPRDMVTRDQGFRPQSRQNPLGEPPMLIDTIRRGEDGQIFVDSSNRIHIPGVGTAGERDEEFVSDTILTPKAPENPAPLVAEEDTVPPITLNDIVQAVIKKPLFDWNGTRFNFVQSNSSSNAGLKGNGPGITNFFARGIFSPESDDFGPGRAYQLGLITDPHGRLLIRFVPKFPFISFGVRHGNRAPSLNGRASDVTDVFTQTNNFELSTSRPLWEGANLSLNWKLQFSYDERNTLRLQPDGVDSLTYFAKSGDVSRTFLSIPPIFPFLKSGIEEVGRRYEEKAAALGAVTALDRDNLPIDLRNRIQRESFMEGFETLPFFKGFLREYLPRLNYSFSWSGLQKFPLFSFADRASLRHAYNGNYRRSYRFSTSDSLQLTTVQSILYGFRPLIALDMSWDDIYQGRLSANLNYDTQTEWNADYSSQRINKRLSTTIGLTANYARKGLKLPFLGLDLKNEFGASLTISKTISSETYFSFDNILSNPGGTGNGGLTKTTIQPRVTYSVSQQLSLEGYYLYELTTPAATGLISPPTRLIEAGIDVRLKIQ